MPPATPDRDLAERLVESLIQLEPVDLAGLDIAALRRSGEVGALVATATSVAQRRWRNGGLTVEEGAALFAGLDRLLRDAEPGRTGGGRGSGRVLLLVPEGEQHLLGPRLLRREFSVAGAEPELVIGQPVQAWLDRVATEAFDVVGLSIGHDELLAEVQDWIQRIRLASCNAGVRIMVGGAALTGAEGAYRFLAADLVTNDIAVALSFVERARRRPERAH